MKESNIETICGAKVIEIEKDKVHYEKDGKTYAIPCDVVAATGYVPAIALLSDMEVLNIPVNVIGDSKSPRIIFDAVHEAYHTIRMLFN